MQRILPYSVYGDKPLVQIEKEIQDNTDDWSKTQKETPVEQPTPPSGSEQDILNKGGSKAICILLAKAVQGECIPFAIAASSSKSSVPVQYKDVKKIEDKASFDGWHEAMAEEIKALYEQDVWELVQCPSDRVPVRCSRV